VTINGIAVLANDNDVEQPLSVTAASVNPAEAPSASTPTAPGHPALNVSGPVVISFWHQRRCGGVNDATKTAAEDTPVA
jgi:hypothetical protein